MFLEMEGLVYLEWRLILDVIKKSLNLNLVLIDEVIVEPIKTKTN